MLYICLNKFVHQGHKGLKDYWYHKFLAKAQGHYLEISLLSPLRGGWTPGPAGTPDIVGVWGTRGIRAKRQATHLPAMRPMENMFIEFNQFIE